MPTLILSPRYTENSQILWRSALDLGWNVERMPTFRLPDDFRPEDPVVYGEPLFNDVVAQHLGFSLVEPPEDFLVQIGVDYTNRKIQYLSAAEARKVESRSFFKPPNRKTFPAKVYDSGADLPSLNDDETVLVAEVVKWRSEFRFFVHQREVYTWSSYMFQGEHVKDGRYDSDYYAVRHLVDSLLANETVTLPTAFVLDAGYMEDRGPGILEANEAQASGLYACDPHQALRVIKECVIPQG